MTQGAPWAPATSRNYRQHIDQYLTPAFGTLRLEALKARDVQQWIGKHTRESEAVASELLGLRQREADVALKGDFAVFDDGSIRTHSHPVDL